MGDQPERSPLDELDFYLSDPLARFLVHKHHWEPIKTAIASLLIYQLSVILIALSVGRFLPGASYRGFLVDYWAWVIPTLSVPVAWGYYVWSCTAPLNALKKVEQFGVLQLRSEGLEKARSILSSRLPLLTACLLSLAIAVLNFDLSYYHVTPGWWNATLATAIVSAVIPISTSFVSIMFVARILVAARVFNILLAEVNPQPLHPDRAAGFGSLGQYALRTVFPIAVGGVILAFASYWYIFVDRGLVSTGIGYMIVSILYAVLAPAMFFVPLRSAHDAMKRAKDKYVFEISQQFNEELSQASLSLTKSAEHLEKDIDKIEQIKRLHTIAQSFPTWPFDTRVFQYFLLTFASPLVTFAATTVIDFITKTILSVP